MRSAGLTPAQVLQLFNTPELRLYDHPALLRLGELLMVTPEDQELQELFALSVERQAAQAMVANDPFYGNRPPAGTLPPLVPGRVPLVALPNGEVLSLEVGGLARNLLVVGPTGSGKTNFLFLLLGATLGQATVLAFDRKNELADIATAPGFEERVTVLRWEELRLAMLQPPTGNMRVAAFIIVMVEFLARHLNLFASRRLLLETLTVLFERRRPPGTWPTLSEWVGLIEHIRADSTSRLGMYRESTLYGLKSIVRGLGDVVNCTSSNMLDRIYRELQTFIIIADGLSADLASLLAGLMMLGAYESREWVSDAVRAPLIFILDDALPMVLGTGLDVEGGLNPLSTWAFMGRGRGMGMVVSAQNFSLIHPALRNNTDTIMAFASYGRDAEELSRFTNLTREQAAMLPILRPGQAVALARSVWPLAVHGLVPRVR